MKVRALHREQMIPVLLPEVFSFFSEARNLDPITPPWLHFQVLDQTDRELKAGTLIHYELAWHGLPVRWTTLIEEWCPPTKFVDVQLKGPYRLWRHTHSFEVCDGGTLVRDTVQYAFPLGMLGDLFAGWMVRRDVERIFDYRAKQIPETIEGSRFSKLGEVME
jgi:ligand-binding SRPBCC domain-containing protein